MRKHRARAAKASSNFVHDQVYVIAVAERSGFPQVNRVMHGHASGALHHGLDDKGGGLRVVFFQPVMQAGRGAPSGVGGRFAGQSAARIGAGHGGGQPHQWGVGFTKQGNVSNGQRAHGFAVVATGQANKAALFGPAAVAPVMRAHLQRDLGGAGPVAAVKGVAQAGQCAQFFRQFHHRCVGKTGQHDMVKTVELLAQRRLDVRVTVAKQIDPPGTDAVKVTPALEVMQPDALGAGNRHWRLRLVQLHLRAGVPHVAQAALNDGCVLHGP